MEREEIVNKVYFILIDKLGVDSEEVTETADLRNDLGMDSLDAIELIMDFEKEYSIFIPEDEVEKIKTVGDIINYLENKVI